MTSDWVTTGEAARLLGVRSINTVKRMIRDGRLRATRPGSHYRVRRADVERLGFAGSGSDAARPDPLDVSREALGHWARRHHVKRVAIFGSAARNELRPDSDVDVAIELQPDARIGLMRLSRMETELRELFDRDVDLGTWDSFRPRVRDRAERDALVLYEA